MVGIYLFIVKRCFQRLTKSQAAANRVSVANGSIGGQGRSRLESSEVGFMPRPSTRVERIFLCRQEILAMESAQFRSKIPRTAAAKALMSIGLDRIWLMFHFKQSSVAMVSLSPDMMQMGISWLTRRIFSASWIPVN